MPTSPSEAENNKQAVRRFNTEVIGNGDTEAFSPDGAGLRQPLRAARRADRV